MRAAEIRCRYDAIVEFAGIEPFMSTPVKRYSSGMLARLGFAVASHLDADIILVDEVMSVGDIEFQKRGYDRMQTLRDGGATILSCHPNVWPVSEICERAVRLDHGTVVDERNPDKLFSGIRRRQAAWFLRLEKTARRDPWP